jgi:hypothetical protein
MAGLGNRVHAVPIMCLAQATRESLGPVLGRRWFPGSVYAVMALLLPFKASKAHHPGFPSSTVLPLNNK